MWCVSSAGFFWQVITPSLKRYCAAAQRGRGREAKSRGGRGGTEERRAAASRAETEGRTARARRSQAATRTRPGEPHGQCGGTHRVNRNARLLGHKHGGGRAASQRVRGGDGKRESGRRVSGGARAAATSRRPKLSRRARSTPDGRETHPTRQEEVRRVHETSVRVRADESRFFRVFSFCGRELRPLPRAFKSQWALSHARAHHARSSLPPLSRHICGISPPAALRP